jgi:molybdopterin/thiamine biosynthesis adenylyltransferase
MSEAIVTVADDRFDRFQRIAWWKQDRLRAAKVLVVGAGALGNEVLKNLALLGVGSVLIADYDHVEASNLSRSVLFRPRDQGRPKAQVAAAAVQDIYPDIAVSWFHGDVIYDLGLGAFHWADLVIGGLDSREARLWINRYCWKTKTPWIDGATEVLQGVARVFVPPGACYECTLSEADWDGLKERRGCDGMRAAGVAVHRIPTTPITASIVAGLQCQEAVKLLQGLDIATGSGIVFNGLLNEAYVVRYQLDEECNSHEHFDDIVSLDAGAETTLGALLERAKADLGPGTVLEFNQPLLIAFECPACGDHERVGRPVGSVLETRAHCPRCGVQRQAVQVPSVAGGEPFLDMALADAGVPRFDVVGARNKLARRGYELAGDAPALLGILSGRAAASTGGTA